MSLSGILQQLYNSFTLPKLSAPTQSWLGLDCKLYRSLCQKPTVFYIQMKVQKHYSELEVVVGVILLWNVRILLFEKVIDYLRKSFKLPWINIKIVPWNLFLSWTKQFTQNSFRIENFCCSKVRWLRALGISLIWTINCGSSLFSLSIEYS